MLGCLELGLTARPFPGLSPQLLLRISVLPRHLEPRHDLVQSCPVSHVLMASRSAYLSHFVDVSFRLLRKSACAISASQISPGRQTLPLNCVNAAVGQHGSHRVMQREHQPALGGI